MTEYLFSYGTLQQNDVQLQLFGRLIHGTKDMLRNYTIAPVEITDESFLAKGEDKFQKTLVPSKGDFVEGTALKLTIEELLTADKYEPNNYKRIKIILQSGREAWIYVAVER